MRNKWSALCGISFGIGCSFAIPIHKDLYKSLLTGLGASISTMSTVAILDKFSSADENLFKNGVYLKESKEQIEIQGICNNRDIQICTHFTNTKNLSKILSKGLVPRYDLENKNVPYFPNDNNRIDKQKEANCLNISFPNSKLRSRFEKKREEEDWVVLSLSKEILWELDCAFCSANAAKDEVTNIPISKRKTSQAFEKMFLSSKYPSYPADMQAEVLVFGTIHPKYIEKISFRDKESRDSWISKNPEFMVNKTMFDDRDYFLKSIGEK